ncbi:hypothetical protein Hanom_Chr05g00472481 [Helianthus anomalus]
MVHVQQLSEVIEYCALRVGKQLLRGRLFELWVPSQLVVKEILVQ